MTAAQGWYHAAGDPPGTVRLWNGTDWVGFPQRDPNVAVSEQHVSLGPAHGQQRLKPWGYMAMIGLILPGIGYLFQAYILVRVYQIMGKYEGQSLSSVLKRVEDDPEITSVIELQVLVLLVIGVGTLIAGVLFIPWFFVAYFNLGKWTQTRHESWWALLCWFVPFIQLKRPSTIMQELCESSPRADHAGAINPVVAWAWWLGLITSSTGIRLLQWWAFRETDFTTLRLVIGVSVLLCAVNGVCAFLAIRLVQQISHHQDLRFRRTTMASGTTALARV